MVILISVAKKRIAIPNVGLNREIRKFFNFSSKKSNPAISFLTSIDILLINPISVNKTRTQLYRSISWERCKSASIEISPYHYHITVDVIQRP